MKILIFLFSCFLLFNGCEDSTSVEPDKANFLKLEDRIGTWINHERNDTLIFQNDSSVIRKYSFYSEGTKTHQYKIEDSTLYLDSTTSHKISDLDIAEGKVKLHGIYYHANCVNCPEGNGDGTFEKETE
jgi:hypothetical protein